jgi:hypothetical protein
VFVNKPSIRQAGEKVIFECKLTADPKPTIAWYKGNELVKQGGRYKLGHAADKNTHTITLEIDKVGAGDGAEYKATAKNKAGEASATITLNFSGSVNRRRYPRLRRRLRRRAVSCCSVVIFILCVYTPVYIYLRIRGCSFHFLVDEFIYSKVYTLYPCFFSTFLVQRSVDVTCIPCVSVFSDALIYVK